MKRSIVALAAMASMVVGGTACGPLPEEAQTPAEQTANAGEVQAMACGDYGWWTCPTDGTQFWYEAAGSTCGTSPDLYKYNVKDECENYCPEACVDSGWQDGGDTNF